MAKFGVVPSRGAYAYLQSSAMGGYGSALVQGVTDTARVERSQEGGVEADEPAEMKAKL